MANPLCPQTLPETVQPLTYAPMLMSALVEPAAVAAELSTMSADAIAPS